MAGEIGINDFRTGMKVEVDGQPWLVVDTDFVKPGKGQPFTRVKMKNMITGRVIERTYKAGEKVDYADVEEMEMRLLYREPDAAVFMDDKTFEQHRINLDLMGDAAQWLMEDQLYGIVFYKGAPIAVTAPTFMELRITETAPGVRGDTASGRVMKPATTEIGAKVQVPLFVEEGEVIKIDTRTGTYVSRVGK
jgi:elongation factor P